MHSVQGAKPSALYVPPWQGSLVGIRVGAGEGSRVGDGEGAMLGGLVGAADGTAVVGCGVGRSVGVGEGLGTGALVGSPGLTLGEAVVGVDEAQHLGLQLAPRPARLRPREASRRELRRERGPCP